MNVVCPCCNHSFAALSEREARNELILNAWDKGEKVTVIAATFGVSDDVVRTVASRARALGDPRVPPRRRGRPRRAA